MREDPAATGAPPHTAFQAALDHAQADPNVLAAFLTGSRGKGFHHDRSDYDLYLVTRLAVAAPPLPKAPGLDLTVISWSDLERHAAWASPEAWDRYDFFHTRILFDHTGTLGELLRQKALIPAAVRRDFTAASLDAYINGLYRSLKCHRAGEHLGQRLEAAASLPPLLDALFALEGRPRPFLSYLRKELDLYPLRSLPTDAATLCSLLEQIASTAAVAPQQTLFHHAAIHFRQHGFAHVLDQWRELPWIATYTPAS